jgi:hypothetical protein
MSWKDHQPTDWGWRQKHCIWCHEPWPCPTAKVAAEVLREVATEVKSQNPEPQCCDEHAASWQAKQDIAEEIEERIPEGLR